MPEESKSIFLCHYCGKRVERLKGINVNSEPILDHHGQLIGYVIVTYCSYECMVAGEL